MFSFPDILEFSIASYVDTAVDWILSTFKGFFNIINEVLFFSFDVTEAVLSFIPWFVMILALVVGIWKLYSLKTGLVLGVILFLIGVFGMWDKMIYTLVIVIISVIISILIGIPSGIIMSKSKKVEKIMKPLLDAMQTMPSFVYLIPAIMIFGLGKVPAIFATTIYAVPPLIRLTYLGIVGVDKEVKEAGIAFGSTPMQLLFKIEFPQAMPSIMTGLNQTTMMAMSMVVISSMIGAGGIGENVLTAIRRLEIGKGFEAGLVVVFLAIILDRLLQGFANKNIKTGDNNAE
ncbi:MAG: ABC transporter permease subunit [Bacilli bacterium]|jgi:glycine betaine/proline transport system permease protein|nr:ABC transporter permease subunit [Bacilli bacterium]